MKTLNKHLIAAAIIVGLMPTLSVADCFDRDKQNYKQEFKHEKRSYKSLNLSREQKQNFKNLRYQQQQNEFDIRQKYWAKLPDAEKKTLEKELEANNNKTTQEMRNLLDKNQQVKFDAISQEIRKNKAEWAEFLQFKAQQKQ